MKKLLLITVLLLLSAYLLLGYWDHAVHYYHARHAVPVAIGISAGPVEVSLTDSTDWDSVFKALVTIIGTYLGVKLVNKYVR